MQQFLSLLFEPTDLIYTTADFNSSESRYNNPRLTTFSNVPQGQELFSVQPLSSHNLNVGGSIRHSSNVIIVRNFVFESDTLDIELQKTLVPKVAAVVPIRAAVYSGGKSVHYFISLATPLAPDPDQYKRCWQGLADKIESVLGVGTLDKATKDIVRLARIGGATRANGVKQDLLYVGTLADSDSVLESQVFPTLSHITVSTSVISSATAFATELKAKKSLATLHQSLTVPKTWAASAGLYPKLFRLALWAKDSTGVSEPALLEFMQRYTFPTLKAHGYDRDPSIAIKNAYKWGTKKSLTSSANRSRVTNGGHSE